MERSTGRRRLTSWENLLNSPEADESHGTKRRTKKYFMSANQQGATTTPGRVERATH